MKNTFDQKSAIARLKEQKCSFVSLAHLANTTGGGDIGPKDNATATATAGWGDANATINYLSLEPPLFGAGVTRRRTVGSYAKKAIPKT